MTVLPPLAISVDTGAMRPGRIAYVVGFLVIVASGAYFFIYLYRWEWNRALVAGLLFVSAEIGIGIALVLDRLRRIGDRLGEIERRRGGAEAPLHMGADTPAPKERFEWLAPKAKGDQGSG